MARKGNRGNKKPRVIVQVARGGNRPRRTPNRRNNNQRGRTAPNSKVTVIGRALRNGGALAGGLLGMPSVGRGLGATISRVFGQGDYSTNTPMSNSLFSSGGPPSFSPLTSGFRIRHREYIKDITSSVGFASTTYRIQPGLPDLFPWLSKVAQNFEEYKIHGAVIWLNSSSATAVSSTNTALGMWGVVTQYEPDEPDFISKQECENYVGAQSAVPSKSLLHGIECKPGSNVMQKYFVRTNELSPDQDIKFYDQGKVQVFTQGSQAVSTIGELWISYDIEFTKPKLSTRAVQNPQMDVYSLTNPSNVYPLGTVSVKRQGSSGNIYLDQPNTSIVFPTGGPVGLYQVELYWSGTAAVTTGPTTSTTGSISAYDPSFPYNLTMTPTNGTSTTRLYYQAFFYKKSLESGSVIFGSATIPQPITAAQLTVTMVPPLMYSAPTKALGAQDVTDLRDLLFKFRKLDLAKLHEMLGDESQERDEEEVPKLVSVQASFDQVD